MGNPNPNSFSGSGLSMAPNAFLLQGFMTLVELEQKLMEKDQEMVTEFAKAYGDQKTGIMAQYMKAAITSADSDKNSLSTQGLTLAIGAGVGALALGASAGCLLKTSDAGETEQVKNLKALQTKLSGENPDQGADVELQDLSQEAKINADQHPRLKAWKDQGGESFNSYQAKIKPANAAQVEKDDQLNDEAIAHFKNLSKEDQAKINDNLSDQIKEVSKTVEKKDQKFMTWSQQLTQVANLGSSATQAAGQLASANFTYTKDEKNAEAQVNQMTSQQVSGQVDSLKQQQSQQADAATQAAAGYGSMVITSSHA